jgi:hypothetical protein
VNERHRRSTARPATSGPPFLPGSIVRWFADQLGWPLDRLNIVVEGELDQKYLFLASDLYREACGRALTSPPLSIFPTGIGVEGGTDGILEHFPLLRMLIERDVSPEHRMLFRAIVVFDNDSAGKKALNRLRERYATLRDYYDLFLIHRQMPRATREPGHLSRLLKEVNREWNGMDCEMEDLLSSELLAEFVRENPRRCRREPVHKAGGHHFEFSPDAKSALFRFARDYATVDDVAGVIELLKSLRFYLGLDPEGDPIPR